MRGFFVCFFLILFMSIFDCMHSLVTYLVVHSSTEILSKNISVISCCDVGVGGRGGQYVLSEWDGFICDRHCGACCWCTRCRPTGHRLDMLGRPELVAVVAANMWISGSLSSRGSFDRSPCSILTITLLSASRAKTLLYLVHAAPRGECDVTKTVY